MYGRSAPLQNRSSRGPAPSRAPALRRASRSSSTTPSPFPSSAIPTQKSCAALQRVLTVLSLLAFAPSSSHAAATPKIRLPAPLTTVSHSMSSSVRASTPSLTAILTRTSASSRSITLRRRNGNASCLRPALCLLLQTSPMLRSTSNVSHSASNSTPPDSTRPFQPSSPGLASFLTSLSKPSARRSRSSQRNPQASGVVLDYGQPRSALPFLEKLAHDSLAARVKLAGEPFQLFFTPPKIAAELTAFRNLEDIGSSEINARYFANRTDNLKILGSAGRLLSAWL